MADERFNILLVKPEGFEHAAMFNGVLTMLYHGLRRLDYPVRIADNQFVHDATNIVVGAHYLDPGAMPSLPPGAIVYNTEMVVGLSPFLPALVPFVQRFETWDYSRVNVERWRSLGLAQRVRWVPPGYLPEFSTVAEGVAQDIDVLFYGSLTPRRHAILEAIRATGLAVHVCVNTYGAERRALIGRARIVLNVHSRDDSVFEIARLSDALSNRRMYLTEPGGERDVPPGLDAGYATAPAAQMPEACVGWARDHARREAMAALGHELWKRHDFTSILREVLALRASGRAIGTSG